MRREIVCVWMVQMYGRLPIRLISPDLAHMIGSLGEARAPIGCRALGPPPIGRPGLNVTN